MDGACSGKPSSLVHMVRLDSFLPEKMEEAVSGGTVGHMQLAKGRFQGTLLRADLGQSHLDWGGYNLPLLASGEFTAARVTLGFVLEASDTGLLNCAPVEPGTPVILGEGAELHYKLAPRSQWAALQIDRATLEHAGVFLPTRSCYMPGTRTRLARQLCQALFSGLRDLRGIAHGDPIIVDPRRLANALQENLLGRFCRVIQEDCTGTSQSVTVHRERRIKLVRRTMEWLDANISEPIQIGKLCAEMGASWSTLERAFDKVYGITPKRALDLRRMTLIRGMLIAGSSRRDSVVSVAHACGINHVGRFAAEYRRLFGESPSQTLAR